MSGGFFRGTSADQDTRFSNKQAKLLKSQKFAPELEHLVDMKKVKMDVMRPWIANRVTELLGFEDEVLINFIYGLLDAKEVNGKEIQISLTGFMEKNTGKFMKELWTLLLSAQKNESGVPQQFLDAKEEETRKKQAEVDRITNEIQRKKEKDNKEIERDRLKKMDGGAETKATFDALESASKHLPKESSGYKEDEKAAGNRNGMRGRNRFSRSPESAGHSASPPRGSPSRSSSDNKSRSLSRSPEARKRAISPKRPHQSLRRSVTPRRRYSSRDSRSPTRRISSYSRQRSRSPSPMRRRRRSPIHRRSPSPIRRRSPSPARRRRSPSPVRRRRSPSPIRRRRSPSPVRRRISRSPIRRISPPTMRRRVSPSPTRRRRSPSPIRRRKSPSPIRRRRSPSPLRRRRSPSPMSSRSPSPIRRGRSPVLIRRRSPNPRHRSPSPARSRYQRSPSTSLDDSPSLRHKSPISAQRRSPNASPRRYASPRGSSSPSPVSRRIHSAVRGSSKEHRMSPADSPEQRASIQEKPFSVSHRPASSLRSPQRALKALSPSPRYSSEDRRSNGSHERHERRDGRRNRSSSSSRSPARQRLGHITNDDSSSPPLKPKQQKPYHRTTESGHEDEDSDYARDYKARSSEKGPVDSSIIITQKTFLAKVRSKDDHSERVPVHQATDSQSRLDIVESRRRDQEKMSDKGGHQKGPLPQTPERHNSPVSYKDSLVGERLLASPAGGKRYDEKDRLRPNNAKDKDVHHKSEIRKMAVEKVDQSNGDGALNSVTEGSGKQRPDNKEKQRHKRSHREENGSDNDSYDSEIEEKREAKRRRKEEKKQKKEEKRRRREERRRRREERRAEKLKRKDPSGSSSSGDEHSGKRESHPSDSEDAQSEQKRLEFELRKKAIESLKAKKGISH